MHLAPSVFVQVTFLSFKYLISFSGICIIYLPRSDSIAQSLRVRRFCPPMTPLDLLHYFATGFPRVPLVKAEPAQTIIKIAISTVFRTLVLLALKPSNHGDTNSQVPRTRFTHSSHIRNAARAAMANTVIARPTT